MKEIFCGAGVEEKACGPVWWPGSHLLVQVAKKITKIEERDGGDCASTVKRVRISEIEVKF